MRNYYAGLDVGDQTTSVCVIHETGKIVLETRVDTGPVPIAAALGPYRAKLEHIGLESGSKSAWLYKELTRRRFRTVCLDARYANAALGAKRRKSDATDAHGIAQLLCRRIFTTAHVRSDESIRIRALLIAARPYS